MLKNGFENRGLASCHYGFEGGFEGICDTSIINYIDSLLADSIPKFIYWTTLDVHPPYELSGVTEKSAFCKELSLSNVDCTYLTLQENSMRALAKLASKHPECHFVIRGDHRPMGSVEQTGFVQSFYFRWVPIIVIN